MRLGRYELTARIAVGGMAQIFLARAAGADGFVKHVVVKMIRPDLASDERFVRMFLDEARLSACLQHQNVAQVYDVDQDGDAFFFAMEYLHGANLRQILDTVARRGQGIPLRHALTIAAGAAAGLHYAHERRSPTGAPLEIVHRDVSLSNIIVTYDGAVKVLDFGIARAAERSVQTRTGILKGTISYMSPEQCLAEPLDRRSDIFSLGIVLYEMTTMSRLFRGRGDSDFKAMRRIVDGDVPPPSSRRPGYPAELERIVLRALARDRDERYATTRELLADVMRLAASRRVLLSPAALAIYLEETLGTRPEPWRALAAPAVNG